MDKKYVIQWKSKVNGRAGRGSKLFAERDAQRLADELNHEYPQIEHQILPVDPSAPAENTSVEPEPAMTELTE